MDAPSPADEDLAVFDRIIDLLTGQKLAYELYEHEFVHHSEDAAKIRDTKLEEAAKALVLCAQNGGEKIFFMCVVSGHRRLDLKRIKEIVGSKNVSLAHPDDVLRITGLRIGTVPPFPSLLELDGYCDAGVLENSHVVFSAGSHYKSIRMPAQAWAQLAGVTVEKIAKDENA